MTLSFNGAFFRDLMARPVTGPAFAIVRWNLIFSGTKQARLFFICCVTYMQDFNVSVVEILDPGFSEQDDLCSCSGRIPLFQLLTFSAQLSFFRTGQSHLDGKADCAKAYKHRMAPDSPQNSRMSRPNKLTSNHVWNSHLI